VGSGIKTWATGDVLTATDLNGYLMRQSVVTCTSGTRPSSPITGQPIYETNTKVIRVWDGSAWYCPASPDYIDYTPTFYSNANAGTTIAGASVSVSYSRYQKVNSRVHYYGHATINTTTASGFAVSLPANTPTRVYTMSSITLHGASATYDVSFGDGHVPAISAPFNRFGPVSRSNAQLNIAASGDTVHWNVWYEGQ
jgi:hypothetical protein